MHPADEKLIHLPALMQADKNNDGKVDYNEFCNLMRTSMTKREM